MFGGIRQALLINRRESLCFWKIASKRLSNSFRRDFVSSFCVSCSLNGISSPTSICSGRIASEYYSGNNQSVWYNQLQQQQTRTITMSSDSKQSSSSTHRVFVALGTNLGDRVGNMKAAMAVIKGRFHFQTAAQSAAVFSNVYETAAEYVTDQPPFLNAMVQFETSLTPEELLKTLKDAEQEIGRRETFRWGPRVIDLDIIFYDDIAMKTESLIIPHERMHERIFVLKPLCDIDGDKKHPIMGVTCRELLARVEAQESASPPPKVLSDF
eukprot:Nk52_evm13s261 gene=Nk52_evmTU13s261